MTERDIRTVPTEGELLKALAELKQARDHRHALAPTSPAYEPALERERSLAERIHRLADAFRQG